MILGPLGQAKTGPGPRSTADRLLSRDDFEFVRTLISAAHRLEDRSTLLWLIVKGFHLMGWRQQCAIVVRFLRGFSLLPAEEQATVISKLAPRIRIARHGSSPNSPFPLVGPTGREEADATMVEFLDVFEASLLRLSEGNRQRLHKRLDAAVTAALTPAVWARLLAKLQPDEVQALEAWVVDEGALPADSASKLFLALSAAGHAEDTASYAADSLWKHLFEDFQNGDVDSFWAVWAQGTNDEDAESKSDGASMSGSCRLYVPAQNLPAFFDDSPADMTATPANERRQRKTMSVRMNNSDRANTATLALRRTTVCQLHCASKGFIGQVPEALRPAGFASTAATARTTVTRQSEASSVASSTCTDAARLGTSYF